MSIHYAIINDLSNAPRESATMEVTCGVATNVEFRVHPNDTPASAPFTMALSNDHYCCTATSTSPNLFTLSNNKRAIVRASVDGITSNAILRQRAGGTKIMLYVPPSEQIMGIGFAFPMGDVGSSSHLLVGNPGGAKATVRVRFGAPTAPIAATHEVATWHHAVIPIPNGDTRVLVASDIPVFVQLAVDTGKLDETFILPS